MRNWLVYGEHVKRADDRLLWRRHAYEHKFYVFTYYNATAHGCYESFGL